MANKQHNTNEEWTIRLVCDLKEASAPNEYNIMKKLLTYEAFLKKYLPKRWLEYKYPSHPRDGAGASSSKPEGLV